VTAIRIMRSFTRFRLTVSSCPYRFLSVYAIGLKAESLREHFKGVLMASHGHNVLL
jgi:hypothetical protein